MHGLIFVLGLIGLYNIEIKPAIGLVLIGSVLNNLYNVSVRD